jgi:hypothetical protein
LSLSAEATLPIIFGVTSPAATTAGPNPVVTYAVVHALRLGSFTSSEQS